MIKKEPLFLFIPFNLLLTLGFKTLALKGFRLFANLFFLFLVLIGIDLSPKFYHQSWQSGFLIQIINICGLFFFFILLIFLQNIWRKKRQKLKENNVFSQIELLIFQIILFDIILVQKIYAATYLARFPCILYATCLLLYFFGLFIHYFSASYHKKTKQKVSHAILKIRFLIPFAIPFLIYHILMDVILIIPNKQMHFYLQNVINGNGSLFDFVIFIIVSGMFIGAIVIIFPYFIQKIWKCQSLYTSSLKDRLESLCKKAKFNHGGLKIWSIMPKSLTAAIFGIIPKFRYVMFTNELLKTFPENEIEAILAHEIGHSHHKHLIFYSFLLLEFVLLSDLIYGFISKNIFLFWQGFIEPINNVGFYLSIFCYFVIFSILYFRLVYGFFSRLFERQADLHVFHLQLSPYFLIQAFSRIAVANGNIHDKPSWHHGSIRSRIAFIEESIKDPKKISYHDQKVNKAIIYFFCIIAVNLAFVIYLKLN